MASPQTNPNEDLGFGTRVVDQSRLRFLNRDGSFNVERKGMSFFRSLSLYHWLLTMSWLKFFALILVTYLVMNVCFALGYEMCGPDALRGSSAHTPKEHWLDSFFFSVQTSATIGYGGLSPNGLMPNILVTLEALVGLLGFALATGLLFARFSRPDAKIAFSKNAVIAPYKNITAFEFRIVNVRSNQLIEVQATVVMSRMETKDGRKMRKFHSLSLERPKVVFMPLHWVIVHAIDETSPLHGITREQFEQSDPEFLVLLSGIDETFSQLVHARSSYKTHEVVWNARFRDMFTEPDGDFLSIDLRRLDEIERLEAKT